MGDLSELRGLLVIISFLGVFVILIGLIPYEFGATLEGREVNVPAVFEAIDIYSFADYKNFTLSNQSKVEAWTLGNHDFWFVTRQNWFGINHVSWSWWIFSITHEQTWYQYGFVVSEDRYFPAIGDTIQAINVSHLGNQIVETGNATGEVKMVVKCQHTQEQVLVSYNTTTYNNFTHAYDNGELWIFFGMGFDHAGTRANAWDLIGMLLFFQLPEIHWIVNALIAIPIWICIGYLTYILIIKIIPFVGGG